jgi:hypothetical protein
MCSFDCGGSRRQRSSVVASENNDEHAMILFVVQHTRIIAVRFVDVTKQKLRACIFVICTYLNIGQSTVQRVTTPARRPPSFSACHLREQHNFIFWLGDRTAGGFRQPRGDLSSRTKATTPNSSLPCRVFTHTDQTHRWPLPPPRSRK